MKTLFNVYILLIALSAISLRGEDIVTIALICQNRASSLPLFLATIENQTWPKECTNLLIYVADETGEAIELISPWIEGTASKYREVSINPANGAVLDQTKVYESAVAWASERSSHLFIVDSSTFLLPHTLKSLVETRLPIVAPLLRTGGTVYSNFYACVDTHGHFAGCSLNEKLLGIDIVGLVQVPVVHTTYFVRKDVLSSVAYRDETSREGCIIFSDTARKRGIDQYLDTREIYGRILFAETDIISSQLWLCDFEEQSSCVEAINSKISPLFKRDESTHHEKTHHGQYGQDKWLDDNIFKGKCGGVFVDVGAYGIEGSNTYFFEKERAWTGFCVEPQPDLYKKLVEVRSVECINACVTKEPGEVTFLHIQSPAARQLSGIIDQYDERHLDKINRAIAAHGGKKELIQVPGIPLKQMLSERSIEHIDYLSIDVEGAEMLVLESIDYDAVKIDIISVEVNYAWPELEAFLRAKGFAFVVKVGMDQIWRNQKTS